MNHESHPSRREIIQTGIASGFALAVSPVTSWAVTTGTEGITTEEVSIPLSSGQKMPGYLAKPAGKGPFPVVVVVHEIFGVHAYIQDVCRRFAHKGLFAIAPYLYFREGDVTKLDSIDKIRSEVISKVPQAQVMGDIDGLLEWLKKNQWANTKRTTITGFCWGGNVTWMYAAHNPAIKAGVAWYGRVAGETTALIPKTPVMIAPELKVPVLGLYGAMDKGIPVDTLETMKKELAKGKSGSQIVIYPEAEHGFHADYRPSYHEKSAKDAWNLAVEWISKYSAAR